jgi:hypothetical protein
MPHTFASQTTSSLSAPLRTLLMAGLSVTLPLAASAQSNDVKYCEALLAKYDTFFVKASSHGPRRGDSAAEVAASKCREGDPAGIPGLEKALQNAKIDLPPRIQ